MGNKASSKEVDYDKVRQDLKDIMSNPDWDDGSYAPGFIRLAWHSSGTYDKDDAKAPGGSNGATMRFPRENNDPENAGLDQYYKLLEPIKKKHPGISYSDLWILAAYVALEVTDGPVIKFEKGRQDKKEKDAIFPGRLPEAEHGLVPYNEDDPASTLDEEGRIKGWENLATHIRQVFNRMGFNDQEIVALLCGGHVYGRCHRDFSGYEGAWVENPVKFSNEYAADMVEDEWMYVQHNTKVDGELVPDETRPAPGKRQYMTKWAPTKAEDLVLSDFVPTEYKPGRYKVTTGWINVRRSVLPDSYVIDQPERNQEFNIVCVRQSGKGVRGQLDVGGWLSIVSTSGLDKFLERVGDLDIPAGDFRLLKEAKDLVYSFDALPEKPNPPVDGMEPEKSIPDGKLTVEKVHYLAGEEGIVEEIYGETKEGKFVLLLSQKIGALFERILGGYNDEPRQALKKKQVQFQMMLPADMVMVWDEGFKEHLKVYAEDEDKLKEDFGQAYKKLTELGVPGCPVAH